MSDVKVKCGNRANGMGEHYHESAAQVRECYSNPTVTAGWVVPSPPVRTASAPALGSTLTDQRPRRVVHIDAAPTFEQLAYIRRLGGDDNEARSLTRGQCAALIDRLKGNTVSAPVSNRGHATIVPVELLEFIPEGRYAVRPDANSPWHFMRLTRPKKGQFAGTVKVQYQSSDTLILAWVYWPLTGTVRIYDRTAEGDLLLLIPNRLQAAVDYGREIGQCCCCGKTLTDEVSRHYGQGPECFKKWPEIRAHVDDQENEDA